MYKLRKYFIYCINGICTKIYTNINYQIQFYKNCKEITKSSDKAMCKMGSSVL